MGTIGTPPEGGQGGLNDVLTALNQSPGEENYLTATTSMH